MRLGATSRLVDKTLQLERAAFTQNDHYLAASKARFVAQYKTARAGSKDSPAPAPASAAPIPTISTISTVSTTSTVDTAVAARHASVSTIHF